MANITWITGKRKSSRHRRQESQKAVVPRNTPTQGQVDEWLIISSEVASQLVFRAKWCPVIDFEDLQQEAWSACWEHYYVGIWSYFDDEKGSLIEYRELKTREQRTDEEEERLKELEKAYAYFRRSVINHVKKYIQRQMPPRIMPSDLRRLERERIQAFLEEQKSFQEEEHGTS